MKKAISTPLLAIFVCSCFVSVCASQGPDQPKPKSDTKNANISTSAELSANSGQPRATSSSSDSPAELNVEARRHYDSAMALSEAGKLDEAIVAFKQSLKLRPEDPQTNFSLGMAYSKSKAYKDAFDSFKRAVRYKPDWPEARFRLGMMSYVLGKRNQSLDEYKKLVELNSQYANILYRIIKDEKGPVDVATAIATSESVSNSEPKVAKPTSEAPASPVNNDSTSSTVQPLTEIYRVGVGDVLDVRILNSVNSRSTLFTVISGGVIDLPVAGGSIAVAGLTVDEIQTRIASELKRRA